MGVVCDDHGCLVPSTVSAGWSHFSGVWRAVCEVCGVVFPCYECPCDWVHDCG